MREGFEATKREGLNSFGDDRVFIAEVHRGSAIGIQILGDTHGNVFISTSAGADPAVAEGGRGSADRRFVARRKAMGEQCVALLRLPRRDWTSYRHRADATGESFYFLEMNTRLQVEHPVTEAMA